MTCISLHIRVRRQQSGQSLLKTFMYPPRPPTPTVLVNQASGSRKLHNLGYNISELFVYGNLAMAGLLLTQLLWIWVATRRYLHNRTTITVINRLLRVLLGAAYFCYPRNVTVLKQYWSASAVLAASLLVPPLAFLQQALLFIVPTVVQVGCTH